MLNTFKSGSPSAKVADSRLILTLPDAETPALWVMDLNDAATSVLRLENDRQGLFVIKKHGGKGAAETVAVYRDRHMAANALSVASKALEKARDTRHQMLNGRPVIVRPASRIARILTCLLFVWFVLYLMGLDMYIVSKIFSPSPQPQLAASPTMDLPTAPAAPTAAPDVPAGVPLSADEFLMKQTKQ